MGLDISDPVPAIAGQGWTFIATQPVLVPGTAVRVQSTLTPLVESSWSDLPGGDLSQLDPVSFSYWALSTTTIPAAASTA